MTSSLRYSIRGLEQLSLDAENYCVLLIRYRSKNLGYKSIRKESSNEVFDGDTGCFKQIFYSSNISAIHHCEVF